METVVRSMEMVETAMETDGDGFRGHFPVPAGCRNRDFYPPKFIDGGGGATKLFQENCRLP
jgi:hypothetical protein